MKPNYGIKYKSYSTQYPGRTVFYIDPLEASYQGHPIKTIGGGFCSYKMRQKFENILVIMNSKEFPLIRYI